ncbi:MAG: rRNA maturation RNase YbeY [Bacteroidales bacterium]|nr:rRNA maturation RNase YbeY [Bacteroidales bacterium]
MISFYSEGIKFDLDAKLLKKKWLKQVAAHAGYAINELNYIFCNDNYLLDLNYKYLGHDYFTDVITFDNREDTDNATVIGDIFISIDTVEANGVEYGEGFERELHRVMVHGLLHLVGYDDLSDADKSHMRAGEDSALELLSSIKEV